MAELQKLAIIVNELGGYDEASSVLGIDENLLQYAIEGGNLTRTQNAEINKSFSNFELDEIAQIEAGIDFDNIDNIASDLTTFELFTGDTSRANELRGLVADGLISLDDVQNNYGLFADLNATYQDAVLQWITEGNDANVLFEAYENDDNFWDIEDSAFWRWYRDTFYSD